MNGSSSKLLRKISDGTKADKRNWNSLTDKQKYEIRFAVKNNPKLIKKMRGALDAKREEGKVQ